MKIKDLSSSERPRERLLSSGPQALSNGELLAVLLRSGTASSNVLDVSRSLLRSCDGKLVRLSQMDINELQREPGMGPAKAAVLAAAFELGRRFADERAGSPGRIITGSHTVYGTIVRLALSRSARSIILVHNHPAGNPEPSQEDIRLTQNLARTASACSLTLLDHVIVSDDSFYSLAEEKLFTSI